MKLFAGENIRHTRISLGLSTQSLSAKLGISRSYLTLIEIGKRPLPKSLFRSLSASLKLPRKTVREWYIQQGLQGIVNKKTLTLILSILKRN